nr:MAG TPA: DNA helix destabilizing protein [Caudoviricetes sp.]
MAITNRDVTFPARLSFHDLFTPRAAQEGGTPKYQAVLLIPKNDEKTIAAVNTAIDAAVQDAVARGTIKQAIDPTMTQYPPLRDGDRPKNDGTSRGDAYTDHWFISAKASESRKPFVVDGNVHPILDQSEVYSGMYVNAAVQFYVYSNSGNVGVAASLNGIQKVKDGERLGAEPTTAEDVFSALGGQAAPSAGLGF